MAVRKGLAEYPKLKESLWAKKKMERPPNNTPTLIKQPNGGCNKQSQSFTMYTANYD